MNAWTVVLAVGLSGAAVIAWRRRSWGWAAGLGALGLLFIWAGLRWLASQVSWPVLLLIAGGVGLLVWHRWSHTAGSLGRANRRSRRKSGVASGVDVWRQRRRVRALATTVRPSLAALPRWELLAMPTAAVGVRVCRVGPQTVWTSSETVVVEIGGPRKGKTSSMSDQILDAPGAVLITSTKAELYHQLGELRAHRGPVVLFNPGNVGGLASTIAFDPLSGCESPVTAAQLAADMIPADHRGGSGDREHWNDQARRVLAGLLHAAALGGQSMVDVSRWVARPHEAAKEVPALLRRAGTPVFEQDVEQFLDTNDRTRTSITTSIVPALEWLKDEAGAKAGRHGARFDVEWLLNSRATVFLLGQDEAHTKALMCALTGHIAREARRLAELSPGGRLDPPLRMALDEAANICPVPLPAWTSDMGSRGVSMIIACQSRAQLLRTYGPEGTAAILTNADAIVIYGGCSDREDLLHFSTLAGERDEWTTSTDAYGRGTHRSIRRVPVIQPAQIAALRPHRVLVFTGGLPPLLGWGRKAWRRPDIRALTNHRERCKRLRERTRRVSVLRVACGRHIERALALLAGRWPDRFTDRARRRYDYNALRERLDLVPVRRAGRIRARRRPAGPGQRARSSQPRRSSQPGRSGRWS